MGAMRQKKLLRRPGGEGKARSAAQGRGSEERSSRPRVLVVDDSEMVRNFHSYILRDAGFEVQTAADGAQALEEYFKGSFDLIVTDINMPQMDGLTFIRRVRNVDQNIPIIIISTEDEAEDKQQGYDAGANIYIVKPTRPSVLIESIKLLTEK